MLITVAAANGTLGQVPRRHPRIGKVHVDPGDAAPALRPAVTPEAGAYIKKPVEHRRRKKQQRNASPARGAANARA